MTKKTTQGVVDYAHREVPPLEQPRIVADPDGNAQTQALSATAKEMAVAERDDATGEVVVAGNIINPGKGA